MRALLAAVLLLGLFIPALAQRDTIRARVDLVVVPVTVRDADNRFIYDLKPEEFSVYEDGKLQELQRVVNDPLPLSAAVLIDTGVGATALQRAASSIVSMASAFDETDEVALYRFDYIFLKMADFSAPEVFEEHLKAFQKMADGKKDQGGGPILIMPGRGPRWLRWLLDRGAPAKVLNDVLFDAALSLESRPADRRKIILVVSDGQVAGSTTHSLEETRNRLAASQIQVYGITEGIGTIEGSTGILHTYADATGGDVYNGRNQNNLETAFARITEQARYQYALSYVSSNELNGQLPVERKIEVRTTRPGLKITSRRTYLQYPKSR